MTSSDQISIIKSLFILTGTPVNYMYIYIYILCIYASYYITFLSFHSANGAMSGTMLRL